MTDKKPIQNPHDALFRGVFADPQRTGELLRSVLHEDIVAATDWASLERVDASFVDEELRDHQADLLFRARLAGRTCTFYIVFEHKAGPARFGVFQLLRYVVRIWEQCRAEDSAATHLPLVLPILVHTGDGAWSSPCTLAAVLDSSGAPAGLLALQPTFTCKLFDLGATDEAGLRRLQLTVQTLLPLLHLQQLRRQVATAVLVLAWRTLYLRLLAMPGGEQIVNRLYSYVAAVSNDDRKHLRAAYASISKTSEEQYMKTVAEQYIEEGRQEGRQEGLQEGERKGLQLALRMLFEKRFGPAPSAVVQRIENSSPAEFDHLMRRILAAATADDLLA
ncbi:MAG TPA: Rpn family recombination-promoting nuclease/putative transposase [Planctomycetota bacterium]|nr:Rpn family recombination-promoting nuclease/putative transposase [Planctomycetota bacterium]